MSGKQAKRARQAVREAGGEDKYTRKLRIVKQRLEAEELAQQRRQERMASMTPEQKEAARLEGVRAMRNVAAIMSMVAGSGIIGIRQ